jgi:hypothetical protein
MPADDSLTQHPRPSRNAIVLKGSFGKVLNTLSAYSRIVFLADTPVRQWRPLIFMDEH